MLKFVEYTFHKSMVAEIHNDINLGFQTILKIIEDSKKKNKTDVLFRNDLINKNVRELFHLGEPNPPINLLFEIGSGIGFSEIFIIRIVSALGGYFELVNRGIIIDNEIDKEIHFAFIHLTKFWEASQDCQAPGIVSPTSDLQKCFSNIVRCAPLNKIYEIAEEYSIPPGTVSNLIILHGGYFKLVSHGGLIDRAMVRYIDSLYQPIFPPLNYNTINEDINAPWLTLPAQEAILDMDLEDSIVIEYGSGISSFFFNKRSKQYFSFEDNELDKEDKNNWYSKMQSQSKALAVDLNIQTSNKDNKNPEWIVENLFNNSKSLLIVIDGLDRANLFKAWSNYITNNKDIKAVLIVDNSEKFYFKDSFEMLYHNKAIISHYYGNVYGQTITRVCTSFVTFDPSLLVNKSPAPNTHDKTWSGSKSSLAKMTCLGLNRMHGIFSKQ